MGLRSNHVVRTVSVAQHPPTDHGRKASRGDPDLTNDSAIAKFEIDYVLVSPARGNLSDLGTDGLRKRPRRTRPDPIHDSEREKDPDPDDEESQHDTMMLGDRASVSSSR